MSASLFDLISLAGSASLDELRARSSVDDITLANTLASMVALGLVTLSVDPQHRRHAVIKRLGEETGELEKRPFVDRDALRAAIQAVLESTDAAVFVTASPTSRGIRSTL